MSLKRDLDESATWLVRLKSGDDRVYTQLWDRFFRRMVEVARVKIPAKHRVARDEEDIALSAFKSFCLGFQDGRFTASDSVESLWPLLVKLTINKANDHLRYNLRKKRADTSAAPDNQLVDIDDLIGLDDPIELRVAADEVLDQVVKALEVSGDEDLVEIVLAALQGESNHDIALNRNCSLRTIQRKLKTIHRLWEALSE